MVICNKWFLDWLSGSFWVLDEKWKRFVTTGFCINTSTTKSKIRPWQAFKIVIQPYPHSGNLLLKFLDVLKNFTPQWTDRWTNLDIGEPCRITKLLHARLKANSNNEAKKSWLGSAHPQLVFFCHFLLF